ncbi:hypothetical protein HY947_01720 [Candidatus Gottesmanbacteria bacterium]|nr:hypothetical protein [Candidatus Gottesmanbacteria bacterium]
MNVRLKYKDEKEFQLSLSVGAKLKDALTMAMGNNKLPADLDLTRLRATRRGDTVLQNTVLAHGDYISLT